MSTTNEYAWAAGYLEGLGVLSVAQGRIQLLMKTTRNLPALQRLADIAGVEARDFAAPNGSKGLQFMLAGETLHQFLTLLWPYLTKYRKVEYKRLLDRLRSEGSE